MPDLTGQSMGRYQIITTLGEGGMATVYKALDTRLERQVAIKFIRQRAISAELAEKVLARFEREAKRMAQFTHPNIVPIMDYGEYEGSPFLVMPYLTGGTVKALTGKAMPYREAARLLAPVARALEYAHEAGTIHRDVKPANILLTNKGQPMLSDFGVAKILDLEEGKHTLTGTGVVGTPKYMAPEQWKNQISPQTDIYALGVVFYELITGRAPYDADTPGGMLEQQLTEPVTAPSLIIPGLPDEVEQILLKAMSRKPHNRQGSMSIFAAELERLATQETLQSGETTLPSYVDPKQVVISRLPSSDVKMPQTLDAGLHQATTPNRIGQQASDIKSQKPMLSAAIRSVSPIPSQLETSRPSKNSAVSSIQVTTERVSSGKMKFWVFGVIAALVLLSIVVVVVLYWMPAAPRARVTQPVIAVVTETAIVQNTVVPILVPQDTATAPTLVVQAANPTQQPQSTQAASKLPLQSTTTPVSNTPLPQVAEANMQLSEKDGMQMILIPSGDFKMGSTDEDKDAYHVEKPQHKVFLDAFWMDKTEITNAFYRKCVQTNGCQAPAASSIDSAKNVFTDSQYDLYPVVSVTWEQAKTYCKWADRRLPSEAEWEKAARGPDGNIYPWGKESPNPELLNFNDPKGGLKAVGSYPAGSSPYGILDMAGNAWEWVEDWYDGAYYDDPPSENPKGLQTGQYRVFRGGAWYTTATNVRAAYRGRTDPESSYNNLGFRCVK